MSLKRHPSWENGIGFDWKHISKFADRIEKQPRCNKCDRIGTEKIDQIGLIGAARFFSRRFKLGAHRMGPIPVMRPTLNKFYKKSFELTR